MASKKIVKPIKRRAQKFKKLNKKTKTKRSTFVDSKIGKRPTNLISAFALNLRKLFLNSRNKSRFYIVLGVFGLFLIIFSQWYLWSQRYKFSFNQIPTHGIDYVRERKYPERIVIPSANIDLKIEPGYIYKGVWGISTSGATHLRQSAAIGETGNIVIYGHNKTSIFGKLKTLKTQDLVYLYSKSGELNVYSIKNLKTVRPSQIEVVAPTDYPVLTIYTCIGFLDTMRFVVQAYPIN